MHSFNGFVLPKPERKSGGGLWMHDWSAFQTVYDWSGNSKSVGVGASSTFYEANGEGFVTFCRAISPGSNNRAPSIRFTIDGIPVLFDGLPSTNQSLFNLITQPIYFKQSIKIEAINHDVGSINMIVDYTVLLKVGQPQVGLQKLLTGTRKIAYNSNNTASMVDAVNVSGSGYLLGFELTQTYGTAQAIARCTVEIDGVVKMNARNLITTTSAALRFPFFQGPIRYNTSLTIRHALDVVGSASRLQSEYTID